MSGQLAASGASPEAVDEAKHLFDPNALTLGFARRFATYKRPNLLLHDPERLLRLLTNPQRPVQLIIAGKAHPADQAGQALIQEWMQFHPAARGTSACDLPQRLRHAVDRAPGAGRGCLDQHAAAALGGVRNERHEGARQRRHQSFGIGRLVGGSLHAGSGLGVGDGQEHGDDPAWDAAEAEALYDLLEREVIPEFYTRDEQGIPTAWVARMRESMARLTPRFSANRAVREYTEQHYLPAAAAYRERAANKGAIGKQIVDWQHSLEQKWAALHFGEVKVETRGEQHVFEVQVSLNDLDPKAVRVELYADGVNGQCSRAAGDEAHSPTHRRRRLRLQRGRVCGPPTNGLYGASDTALRRRRGAAGSRSDSLAAVNLPRTGENDRRQSMKAAKTLKRLRKPTARVVSVAARATEKGGRNDRFNCVRTPSA